MFFLLISIFFFFFKAIIQAINETEATLLVTSAELLTKIATVRKKISQLRSLVYFRPLHPSKKLTNIDIIRKQFENVVSLDELEKYKNNAPGCYFWLKSIIR